MNRNYPITDCPITGLKRIVRILGFEVSNEYKWARLDCDILYFTQAMEEVSKEFIMPKRVNLISDNEEMVNPLTGEYVFKDENGEYPQGSMGEFDWMEAMAEQLNIQAMYDRAILTATAKGKFN